jgi:Uma2 family endonuclease
MGTTAARPKYFTLADLQARVGHVPPVRLPVAPGPGTATEQDLVERADDRPCELVDGVLVEKTMGWTESRLAALLSRLIGNFVDEHNLGVVAGADGGIRFKIGLVRMPDVSFVSWDAVNDPTTLENPAGAFLDVPPDLAVEVLSPGNTPEEMAIKLAEYARAGVKLVWYVDPERREVDVYPKGRAKGKKTFREGDVLDGGAVLPGFALPVADIFKSRAPAKKPGRKKK